MRRWPAYAVLAIVLVGCEPTGGPGNGDPPVSLVTVPEYVDAALNPTQVIESDTGPRRPRPSRRADIPASEIVAAPETGVDLGWGWRGTQGEAVPTRCVEFGPAQAAGQTVSLEFSEVQDSYELAKSLDMSSAATVKGVGYKVSGEAKFAKNTRVKTSETTFVIEAEVLNPAAYASPPPDMDSVRLTTQAVALARRNDGLAAFKQVCGDGYVSALTTGAKFIAVVAVKTRSVQERESLRAKIEGGGWGVKVNAAMNSESSSARDSMQRRISVHQSGGAPAEIPMEPEEIVAHAKNLAMLADAGGKLFRLAVTPYQNLSNWPAGKDLQENSMEFDQLADLWGAYSAIYAEIDAALARPADYAVPMRRCLPDAENCAADVFESLDKPGARAIAEAVQDEALAALERLNIAAQDCVVKAEACDFDEAVFRSPYALRVRAPILTCLITTPPAGAPTDSCEVPANLDFDTAREIFVDVMVRTPAKSRCRIDPFMLGCLSNVEISEWERRVGLASAFVAPGKRAAESTDALLSEPWPAMIDVAWTAHPPAAAADQDADQKTDE
jgi:hypothetical protein